MKSVRNKKREEPLKEKDQRIDCDSGHHLNEMNVGTGENADIRMERRLEKRSKREQEPQEGRIIASLSSSTD